MKELKYVPCWTHSKCYDCWSKDEGDRIPVRVMNEELVPKKCCFCGRLTIEGIFTRRDPKDMSCQHEEDDFR